jgi:hypothetical protein
MDPAFRISVQASFGELAEAGSRMLKGSNAGLESYPPDTKLTAAYFENFFAEAVRAADARGVHLYCGEYGVIDRARPEDALEWYRHIHAAFEKYAISRCAWSYKRMDFGLSDARMDGVRDELLKYL